MKSASANTNGYCRARLLPLFFSCNRVKGSVTCFPSAFSVVMVLFLLRHRYGQYRLHSKRGLQNPTSQRINVHSKFLYILYLKKKNEIEVKTTGQSGI